MIDHVADSLRYMLESFRLESLQRKAKIDNIVTRWFWRYMGMGNKP
jgi:hypothetical protein